MGRDAIGARGAKPTTAASRAGRRAGAARGVRVTFLVSVWRWGKIGMHNSAVQFDCCCRCCSFSSAKLFYYCHNPTLNFDPLKEKNTFFKGQRQQRGTAVLMGRAPLCTYCWKIHTRLFALQPESRQQTLDAFVGPFSRQAPVGFCSHPAGSAANHPHTHPPQPLHLSLHFSWWRSTFSCFLSHPVQDSEGLEKLFYDTFFLPLCVVQLLAHADRNQT